MSACVCVCAARHHVCDSGSYSAAAATCWQKYASLSVFKCDLLQQIMLPLLRHFKKDYLHFLLGQQLPRQQEHTEEKLPEIENWCESTLLPISELLCDQTTDLESDHLNLVKLFYLHCTVPADLCVCLYHH